MFSEEIYNGAPQYKAFVLRYNVLLWSQGCFWRLRIAQVTMIFLSVHMVQDPLLT